jgi:hypothetical protein
MKILNKKQIKRKAMLYIGKFLDGLKGDYEINVTYHRNSFTAQYENAVMEIKEKE